MKSAGDCLSDADVNVFPMPASRRCGRVGPGQRSAGSRLPLVATTTEDRVGCHERLLRDDLLKNVLLASAEVQRQAAPVGVQHQ